MARGRKTGGRNFQPGQSGNPKGMAAISPEFRAAKRMTAEAYKDLVSTALNSTDDELYAIIADPDQKTILKAFAKGVLVGRETGDMRQLNYITDRLLGKVKEEISVEVKKPSILVKTDGSQVMFRNTPSENDE